MKFLIIQSLINQDNENYKHGEVVAIPLSRIKYLREKNANVISPEHSDGKKKFCTVVEIVTPTEVFVASDDLKDLLLKS